MPFVVDASIAVCWLLPDERSPSADAAWRRLPGDTALAPGIWWYELRNVLIVNERRGQLDAVRTAQALRLIRGLRVSIDFDSPEETLIALARRHRLAIYDSAYLELALRHGCPLATLDGELAAAANAEGVQLISTDEPGE